MQRLEYTGSYMEPIKLLDFGEKEIMLHAAESRIIEVEDECVPVIMARYPAVFKQVVSEAAVVPEAKPVKPRTE